MNTSQLSEIIPGRYLFRQNPLSQWTEVQIFTPQNSSQKDLWVRWLNTEVKIEKLINRGEWKRI